MITPAAPGGPGIAIVGFAGVAVTVATALYVLDHAAEAPAANAVVRSIMALTTLTVGLYLWRRQPHNRYGPVLAALDGRLAVGGLGDHVHPALLEQLPQAAAEQLVVVDEYHAHPGRVGRLLDARVPSLHHAHRGL